MTLKFWKTRWWRKRFSKETISKDARIEEHLISGVRFRIIKDFGHNTYPRYIAFVNSLEVVSQRMRNEDLVAACEIHEMAMMNQDYEKAKEAVRAIKNNLTEYNSTRTLWEVANTLILLEDEPEKTINAKYSVEKKKLCEVDKKIEFFFINNAIDLLKTTKILSQDTTNEDYLGQLNVELEETYLKGIGKTRYSE